MFSVFHNTIQRSIKSISSEKCESSVKIQKHFNFLLLQTIAPLRNEDFSDKSILSRNSRTKLFDEILLKADEFYSNNDQKRKYFFNDVSQEITDNHMNRVQNS